LLLSAILVKAQGAVRLAAATGQTVDSLEYIKKTPFGGLFDVSV